MYPQTIVSPSVIEFYKDLLSATSSNNSTLIQWTVGVIVFMGILYAANVVSAIFDRRGVEAKIGEIILDQDNFKKIVNSQINERLEQKKKEIDSQLEEFLNGIEDRFKKDEFEIYRLLGIISEDRKAYHIACRWWSEALESTQYEKYIRISVNSLKKNLNLLVTDPRHTRFDQEKYEEIERIVIKCVPLILSDEKKEILDNLRKVKPEST